MLTISDSKHKPIIQCFSMTNTWLLRKWSNCYKWKTLEGHLELQEECTNMLVAHTNSYTFQTIMTESMQCNVIIMTDDLFSSNDGIARGSLQVQATPFEMRSSVQCQKHSITTVPLPNQIQWEDMITWDLFCSFQIINGKSRNFYPMLNIFHQTWTLNIPLETKYEYWYSIPP